MSITVRLWTKTDFDKLQCDPWLATIFMNVKTFLPNEIKHYPYNLRHVYRAWYKGENEPIDFYATDDNMAIKFLKNEYIGKPDYLIEIVESHRMIDWR